MDRLGFLSKEGERYGDFALISYKIIDELQMVLRELIHLPTNAQVMHLENDDPENVFCLSFKTLPDSSNGAPHILEHTVLCGSRKFPTKDPFFSMNRRSLNTYMNALTGSDFTCYPAASQVEKDFYNLLEVYLDAVFHPQLKELSFLQEGHRLEFAEPNNPQSPLEIKGIVYNEMKGALASVDSRVWHAMMEALVPNLPYAFNSGGDPKEIPNLTYAQLIEFHETYYHPSRCLFFFYGNLPLKKHLDFIQENALKGIQAAPPLDGIGYQPRFKKPVKEQRSYPINEVEELETKHIHAFGWLTTPLIDQKELLALTILDSVLMDTDASLLKKALLDLKLCIHADSFLDNEMTDVPLMIMFRGCKEDVADDLERAVFENLRKIAKEGIAPHLSEASIHQLEFARTEIGGNHSPFGLTLFMRSALAKQHGCAPENGLMIHSLFEELSKNVQDPHFFTPLIEKYFLNNPHFVRLSFAPDPQLFAKETKEEEETLQKMRSGLTEKQVAHILDQTKKLEKFQQHQEGQKLECLPKVSLFDVPKKAHYFPIQTFSRGNLEVFHHDNFTNHILYSTLIFDLPSLTERELFDFQLFIRLWPELGVGSRDYVQNLEYVHAYTGGVSAQGALHVQVMDPNVCRPSLQLYGKALGRNADKLFTLMHEMITKPRLDERERIEEMLKKLGSSLQHRLSNNAMRYASQMALSGFSAPCYITNLWHGFKFYTLVQELVSDIDKQLPQLIERLHLLKDKILCAGKAHLVLSCDAKQLDSLDKRGFYGLSQLTTHPAAHWDFHPKLEPIPNQGRTISSPVAFTAQGFKTINYTHKDAPGLQAATLLLENKILHHRIREQGGAYGSGTSFNSLWGNFYFYAYRDPHIARTLSTFEDSIREMAAGDFDDQDLEEAKLGIIQYFDTPVPPEGRAMSEYAALRDGKSLQMRQDFRDRFLALTPQDVQNSIEYHLLSELDKGVVVSFAGRELLEREIPLIEGKPLEIFST
ncbi:MAG: insulinase family protein [Verrucomicrobia bacterium]|nr:insulinase family protein [Verrucomicrobiota bacterium]